MFPRTRTSIIFAILTLIVVASAFLLTRDRGGLTRAMFLNNQVFYAEVSDGATQAFPPATASSTQKARIPIVVYHIVRPSYPSDSQAVRALAHTPEVFDTEMQYLADAGYHVISFGDLEHYFQNGVSLPTKPIIISFDDGWGDQFQYAFPILQKHHYTATFFVFTNPIGTKGFITWDQLRTMRDAGMTIASHSRSHPYLTKVDNPNVLWSEIADSKSRLEKELGIAVHEFAYPFGQYTPVIVDLVKKAGYASARGDRYTGGNQSNDLLYELNALNAPTTVKLFAQKFPAN